MANLKISFFNREITPETGRYVAGYAPKDVSLGVHDPIYVSGLLFDDGKSKALLLGFDLLGLDAAFISEIRKKCADKLGLQEHQVILTCTHTHSGPQTRTQVGCEPDMEYVNRLIDWTVAGLDTLTPTVEVKTYYYSVTCDANVNRRVICPDSTCKFLPHFKELVPLADGPCDKELGMIFFFNDKDMPVYTLVNYAAHPLCSHAPGTASFLFSADYPGVLRRIIREDTGSDCMFLSGACGDMFPKNYETGWTGVEEMGHTLAKPVLEHMQNVRRQKDFFDKNLPPAQQKDRYLLKDPTLKTSIEKIMVTPAPAKLERYKKVAPAQEMELQYLALSDDICFVGVPGELLTEPGLEIKWHSPFRKTFILYNSTGYFYYLPHGHAVLEGGYEGTATLFSEYDGLFLVNAAVNGMRKLRNS